MLKRSQVAAYMRPDEIARFDLAARVRGDRSRSAALRRAVDEYVRRAVEEPSHDDAGEETPATVEPAVAAIGARGHCET